MATQTYYLGAGSDPTETNITDDDKEAVLTHMLSVLRQSPQRAGQYDICISSRANNGEVFAFAANRKGIVDTARADWTPIKPYANAVSRIFYDLAWFLCLKGVLRPGIQAGANSAPNADIIGYSLTGYGRKWIEQPPKEDVSELLARLC